MRCEDYELINEEGGVEMNLGVPSAIRLEEAYFCLNCEVVTNCAAICPACGHNKMWLLENWIGKMNSSQNGSDKESSLKSVPLGSTFWAPLERIF